MPGNDGKIGLAWSRISENKRSCYFQHKYSENDARQTFLSKCKLRKKIKKYLCCETNSWNKKVQSCCQLWVGQFFCILITKVFWTIFPSYFDKLFVVRVGRICRPTWKIVWLLKTGEILRVYGKHRDSFGLIHAPYEFTSIARFHVHLPPSFCVSVTYSEMEIKNSFRLLRQMFLRSDK